MDNINLQSLGISKEQADNLRAKLNSFRDWNNPEMDVTTTTMLTRQSCEIKIVTLLLMLLMMGKANTPKLQLAFFQFPDDNRLT